MTTIDGWKQSHAEAVRALVQGLDVAPASADPAGPAALRTGGLPVYCDMGGCLVILPSGDVLEYQFEGEVVTPVLDRPSIRLACAAAAEKYQALADLMPTDGATCATCNGTGRLGPMRLRCGVCDGTGLVANGQLR
jgi:hypothetical protein